MVTDIEKCCMTMYSRSSHFTTKWGDLWGVSTWLYTYLRNVGDTNLIAEFLIIAFTLCSRSHLKSTDHVNNTCIVHMISTFQTRFLQTRFLHDQYFSNKIPWT